MRGWNGSSPGRRARGERSTGEAGCPAVCGVSKGGGLELRNDSRKYDSRKFRAETVHRLATRTHAASRYFNRIVR
jgi:hypothetical protein